MHQLNNKIDKGVAINSYLLKTKGSDTMGLKN